MRKMIEFGVETQQPLSTQPPPDGPLSGSSFCVTGTLSEPRSSIHQAIEAAGGQVHTSVKKGTTMLVIGERVGERKIEAARKRGARVITEAELRDLLIEKP